MANNHRTVMATVASDGRPQMSNVAQAFLDGHLEVSTRNASAKVRNLRRDARVTMLVLGDDSWYQYVVVYGHAEILDLPDAAASFVEFTGPSPASIRTGASMTRPWWTRAGWSSKFPSTAL